MKFTLLILSFILPFINGNASAEDTWNLQWTSDKSFESLHFETPLLKGTFVAHDKRELAKDYGRHGLRDMSYKGIDLNAPEGPVTDRNLLFQGVLIGALVLPGLRGSKGRKGGVVIIVEKMRSIYSSNPSRW